MKITEVRLGTISVPLRVPFKTALRSVSSMEDIIVEIRTDTGAVGYGEAPPTDVISGDTINAVSRGYDTLKVKVGSHPEIDVARLSAVHLACAKQIITKIDLDSPVLCSEDPILGGAVFNEQEITVSDDAGLGIKGVQGLKYIG